MQISGLNYSSLAMQRDALLQKQQAASAVSTDAQAIASPSPSDASASDFTPTTDELQNGFMGASLARIKAAATHGYSYNSEAVLAPSDVDLVEKTTGVTVTDGKLYDADGNFLSIEQDKSGNLIGEL